MRVAVVAPLNNEQHAHLARGAIIGALFAAHGTVHVETVMRLCGYKNKRTAREALRRISQGLPIYDESPDVWAIASIEEADLTY